MLKNEVESRPGDRDRCQGHSRCKTLAPSRAFVRLASADAVTGARSLRCRFFVLG
jgi:hypothetical protein